MLRHYTWSLHHTLVGPDSDGDGTNDVTCAYDAAGVRVAQTSGAAATWFLNDARDPTGYTKAIAERTDTHGGWHRTAGGVVFLHLVSEAC